MLGGDREVNKVEIQIIKLKLLQTIFASLKNMSMIRIPQLSSDEKFLPFHKTSLESLSKRFPNFRLVLIISSAIKMAKADLDSVQD
ncbi:unnamed protein product [Linum trigynum]|uniref:Uncharacterized protein n=1 Tax=Linum trigynum TaxID=586398 RepID=A0AAV2EQD3_9ROSI